MRRAGFSRLKSRTVTLRFIELGACCVRRPGLFSLVFLAALFLSAGPRAQGMFAQDVRYDVLAGDERAIIDRIAADFYEQDLRRAQSDAIEAATVAAYVAGSSEERARFREDRRAQWRSMTDEARQSLRAAANPRYDNLTEAQKAPFRRHALNRLAAAGAIDEGALHEALRGDI